MIGRRALLAGAGGAALAAGLGPVLAATPPRDQAACDTMAIWYRLVLELVRHTATMSPPVASRAFAYLGIIAHETMAATTPDVQSLAGRLADLPALPSRAPGADAPVALAAALHRGVLAFFGNTGPTGQRAIDALAARTAGSVAAGLDPTAVAAAAAAGEAVAAHVIAWSEGDGGATIDNLGFPQSWPAATEPYQWVPTSKIALQQAPLLPDWGRNRPFAMPAGRPCGLPGHPPYSEDPSSAFYAQAKEVYDISKSLTDEQKLIARFWSDDPMLSSTPPGHWIAIALGVLEAERAPPALMAEVLALTGIAMADAFIACWASKYEYNLLRPYTYIRRTMDKTWESLLIIPPFPEYPSGHSVQSGAAAAVLTAIFGDNFAFTDSSHVDDGFPARSFPSFDAAAEEAAISRVYGGIHFRAAIEDGLAQGRCVGAFAAALRSRA
ncbi:MAG: vanadium-dependent haloperoxidase [Rhodobacteraceae bacterium]|nr:vanadium-dependent haloperoxidase [Paracoccaceae bacterium]